MSDDLKLVTVLEAKLDKFEKQMKEAGLIADRQVKVIEDRFAKANPSLPANFLKGFVGGALGALSIERVADAIHRTIADLAKIGDVADRVGITAEQLQELRYALEQSGGEASQTGPAMQRFAENLVRAAEGEGRLGQFLRDNNVALRDRAGVLRPTAELLAEIANLIQNAQTPQERLNIATRFFGQTAGPAMAVALKDGAAGLQALGREAQDVGVVLDNDLIKKAQELDDKWNKIWNGLAAAVKRGVINAVAQIEEFVSDYAQGIAEILQLVDDLAKMLPGIAQPGDEGLLPLIAKLRAQSKLARDLGINDIGGKPSTLPGAPNTGGNTNTRSLGGAGGGLDSFERAANSIEKRIASLTAETAAIDLNTAARERARITAELETIARQANEAAGLKNTEVTAAQRAEIDRLAAAYGNAALRAEEARSPLREFARSAADGNRLLQEGAVSALHSFEDALVSVVMGAKNAKEAFRDMANAIVADLARIAVRRAITGPFAGALSGLPGRAAGGPVSAGAPYIVGERGPELFIPRTSGQIVPNNVMRPAGAGGVVVNVTSQPVFQAGMTPTDMAAIDAKLAQNNVVLRQAVTQDLRRGLANDRNYLGG